MENIDLQARGSIRFVAGQVGLSKTTIIRMKKEKQIKTFTMSLKPKLNDGHRSKRLYHCLSKD
jgi:ABC-type ATPase with predicted acetyltransferase domain